MAEAIISTHQVRATQDGRAVEVIATLDAGEVVSGMFLHIPINNLLDFTVRIEEVVSLIGNEIRFVLSCGKETNQVNMVLAFNFEDETLWVLETGED